MKALERAIEPAKMRSIHMGQPNERVDAVHRISLNEIEALAICLQSGGLNKSRWQSLFFPSIDDSFVFPGIQAISFDTTLYNVE